MKKVKRTLLGIVLAVLTITMTGCGIPSTAQILTDWDDKNIYIYSDDVCTLTIDVEVTYGDKQSTISKGLIFNGGETKTISLNDIAPDFFKDDAKIVNVVTGNPMISPMFVLVMIVAILIVGGPIIAAIFL